MTTDIIEQLKWRYATKKFDDTKTLSEEIGYPVILKTFFGTEKRP